MSKLNTIKNSNFLLQRRYEAVVFLALFFGIFGYLGHVMGVANMLNTIMNTAWDLLTNTVFYIMGITVLTGALGRLLIEFGVVRLLEKILAPLMRPVFNLPGVGALAGVLTFLSDNPAIISLANDKNFSKYFKKYELVSLTNFGTAFGMGLIVITFMGSLSAEGSDESYFIPALIGFAGAILGSVISTRIMQRLIRKELSEEIIEESVGEEEKISFKSEGGAFMRFLNSILDGGKSGVDLGLAIIPGVLVISTMVMMVTFGAKDAAVGYAGLPYEGVPILPALAGYLDWLFYALFGFESPELIAFPVTSLGAVGAALSLVKKFLAEGLIDGNVIAVFTAMGMCWSGYLSTHTAMLDTLGYRHLTSKAILSHTIGGLIAGCLAHYMYLLISMFIAI
ncbi:MAG: nucleoside recognition domain-containing protein [Marinifilaceae bacterium]